MKSGQKFSIDATSEYYLNKGKTLCQNSVLNPPQYLLKNNKLSEFRTEEEKVEARKNIGIGDGLSNVLEFYVDSDLIDAINDDTLDEGKITYCRNIFYEGQLLFIENAEFQLVSSIYDDGSYYHFINDYIIKESKKSWIRIPEGGEYYIFIKQDYLQNRDKVEINVYETIDSLTSRILWITSVLELEDYSTLCGANVTGTSTGSSVSDNQESDDTTLTDTTPSNITPSDTTPSISDDTLDPTPPTAAPTLSGCPFDYTLQGAKDMLSAYIDYRVALGSSSAVDYSEDLACWDINNDGYLRKSEFDSYTDETWGQVTETSSTSVAP